MNPFKRAITTRGEISYVPDSAASVFAICWLNAGNARFEPVASQTLKIPDSNKDSFRLVTQEPKGVAEVLILASRTPLRRALQSLRAVAAARGEQRGGPVTWEASSQQNEPAEVIDNLLDDVNNYTRGNVSNATRSNSTVRNIETNQLAALSITFEVI